MDPVVQHLRIEFDPARENLLYRYSVGEDEPRIPSRPWDETQIQELAGDVLAMLGMEAVAPSGADLVRERLERAGSELYGKLIPSELCSRITKRDDSALRDSYLLLRLDRNLLWIPWELLFDGEQFLCQRFRVSREVLGTGEELKARKVRQQIKRNGDVLVAFGDTTDLKAPEEKRAIKTELERAYDDVRLFNKRPANDLLVELTRNYEIVHFIGHGIFLESHPEKTGWKCADSTLLSCKEIEELPTAAPFPLLIFANSCDSAHASLASPKGAERYVGELYLAFLRRGVPHYIGTLAPIPDERSIEFARKFYHLLSQGATIGEALTETRRAFMERTGPPIWAYYVHYGNPTYRSVPEDQTTPIGPQPHRSVQHWLRHHKRLVSVPVAMLIGFLALRAVLALHRQGYFYTFPQKTFDVAVASLVKRNVAGTGKQHAIALFSSQELTSAVSQFLPDSDFLVRTFNVDFHTYDEARRWGQRKHAAIVLWGSAEQGTNALIVHLKAVRIGRPEIGPPSGAFDRSFLYILFSSLFQNRKTYDSDFHLPEVSIDLAKPDQIKALDSQAALLTALVRGINLYAQGKYQDAISDFRQISKPQQDPALGNLAHRWLVLSYLQSHQYRKALPSFGHPLNLRNISNADRVRLAFLGHFYNSPPGIAGMYVVPWPDRSRSLYRFLRPAVKSERFNPQLRGVAIALLGEAYGDDPPWYVHKAAKYEQLIDSAVSQSPNSYLLQYLLAMLTTKPGVREEAFNQVQKLNPSSGAADFGRALWQQSRGNFKAGLEEINGAISADPQNVAYWYEKRSILQELADSSFGRAKVRAERRMVSLCKDFFQSYDGSDPRGGGFLWNLVDDDYLLGEPQRAIAALKKGLGEFSKDAPFCADATLTIIRKLGGDREAEPFLRCAENFSSPADASMLRSEFDWRTGDFHDVLFGYWFNSPLRKTGNTHWADSVALSDIEGNLLNSEGKFAAAEKALRAAKQRAFATASSATWYDFPHWTPDWGAIRENNWQWRWATTFDLGLVFLSEGNYKEAARQFTESLQAIKSSQRFWELQHIGPPLETVLANERARQGWQIVPDPLLLGAPDPIPQMVVLTRICQGYADLKAGDSEHAASAWRAASLRLRFLVLSDKQLAHRVNQLMSALRGYPLRSPGAVDSDELQIFEAFVRLKKYPEAARFIRRNGLARQLREGAPWTARLLYAYLLQGNPQKAESMFLDFARTHGASPSFKTVFSGLSSSLYAGWFAFPGPYGDSPDYFFSVISKNP